MRLTIALAFVLCLIATPFSQGQSRILIDAFNEFTTSRLWEFEEIPIEWKMKGELQADLNEGLNYLLENDPKLAIENLNTVLGKDPSVWQAYYYRAAAQKQLRRFWSAETDMREALKRHGDFYEGLVEMAKILFLRGQPYESERFINRAIRLDRTRGLAYYLKGDINVVQKELRAAINRYNDCLAADSAFHDARIKVALLDAFSRKDSTAALRQLDRVIAIDSLQKTALLFRSLFLQTRDKRQSIRDLTRRISVSPYDPPALYYRGLFSAELGDYQQAFNDFHKLIKENAISNNNYAGQQSQVDKKIDMQNAGAYIITRLYGLEQADGDRIREAYCQILLGEYDKAIGVIDQVTNAKKEPAAVYLKAVALEHKGAHIKALQHYNFAIVMDPDITDAYKKRGIYSQELKEWEKSVKDFTIVLKNDPESYITNRMRGVSYYHLNRFDDAVADFSVYLKNDSTNKDVRGYRAMAYRKTNQRLKAYVDFAMAKFQQGLLFKDMEHLIDSVLQRNDTTTALTSLDIITGNAPWFTEGYSRKLRIHLARNEWETISDHIFEAIRNSRADAPVSHHSFLLTVQAMKLKRDGHPEDALKTLNEAIKFDKRNDFAYLERGRLLLSLQKVSKAEGDLKEAVALGNKEAGKLLASISRRN